MSIPAAVELETPGDLLPHAHPLQLPPPIYPEGAAYRTLLDSTVTETEPATGHWTAHLEARSAVEAGEGGALTLRTIEAHGTAANGDRQVELTPRQMRALLPDRQLDGPDLWVPEEPILPGQTWRPPAQDGAEPAGPAALHTSTESRVVGLLDGGRALIRSETTWTLDSGPDHEPRVQAAGRLVRQLTVNLATGAIELEEVRRVERAKADGGSTETDERIRRAREQ